MVNDRCAIVRHIPGFVALTRLGLAQSAGMLRVTDRAPQASDDATAWVVAIAERRCRASFILLFTHYAPRVKGYLLRRGAPEAQAEELAQEALLSVWRRADQFDPSRASASAWIFTIARNLWIDAIRHDRHPDDGRLEPPLERERTPEDLLRMIESTQRLRRALAALPAEQATVLRLSFFEEQTHAEIALNLSLPLGTVKSRIRLATTQLRRALEDLN